MQPLRAQHSRRTAYWEAGFRVLPFLLVFLLPALQLQRHFGDLQVYPFADEWFYVAMDGNGDGWSWHWLWAQHGDHRIPLQKALQWALLQATEYDFRILVLFNLCVAAMAAVLVLLTARNLRGKTSPWDAMVPLLLFNPMAGYAMWGFHLQFLSSVLFTCLFAWAAFRPIVRPVHCATALLAILGCSLCGVNGLLQATLMVPIAWFGGSIALRGAAFRAALLIVSCWLGWLWAIWTRTGGAEGSPPMTELWQFFGGLVGASILPPREGPWASLVICILACACVLIGHARPPEKDARSPDRMMILLLVAILLQLAAIAWGRARYQGGWQPTLAMHYGVLALQLPIIAWLILAAKSRAVATQILGIVFTLTFGVAWLQAEQWRTLYTQTESAAKARAYQDIKDDRLPTSAAVERNADRYWSSDPSAITVMRQSLPILRRSYQSKWPDHAAAESGPRPGQ